MCYFKKKTMFSERKERVTRIMCLKKTVFLFTYKRLKSKSFYPYPKITCMIQGLRGSEIRYFITLPVKTTYQNAFGFIGCQQKIFTKCVIYRIISVVQLNHLEPFTYPKFQCCNRILYV